MQHWAPDGFLIWIILSYVDNMELGVTRTINKKNTHKKKQNTGFGVNDVKEITFKSQMGLNTMDYLSDYNFKKHSVFFNGMNI